MYLQLSLYMGLRTALVIIILVPQSLVTCSRGHSSCQPRHGVKPFERDALRLALLRKQGRNAREACPEPFYARKWRDSRRALRWLTDK